MGVIKLDILNHFPIYLVAGTGKRMTLGEKVQITKLLIDNETKEKFENTLQKMTWNDAISSKKTGSVYKGFLKKFTFPYDKIFEKF